MKKAPPRGAFLLLSVQKIELSVKEKTCHSADDVQKIILDIAASEHKEKLQKLYSYYNQRSENEKALKAAKLFDYTRQQQSPRQKQQQISYQAGYEILDDNS